MLFLSRIVSRNGVKTQSTCRHGAVGRLPGPDVPPSSEGSLW